MTLSSDSQLYDLNHHASLMLNQQVIYPMSAIEGQQEQRQMHEQNNKDDGADIEDDGTSVVEWGYQNEEWC